MMNLTALHLTLNHLANKPQPMTSTLFSRTQRQHNGLQMFMF